MKPPSFYDTYEEDFNIKEDSIMCDEKMNEN